jgi:GH15 family glucan-1,4-alpha-glucosidase
MAKGYDADRKTFVQYYGSEAVDASALLFPLMGFVDAQDEAMQGTVAAIEKHLLTDGFVRRYDTDAGTDGLSGEEGTFLMCSFWLASNYMALGRERDAHELFEKLLDLRNDVGLLAEEYDPHAKRQLGNVPQAFSHTALVNTAFIFQSRTDGHVSRHPEMVMRAAAHGSPEN